MKIVFCLPAANFSGKFLDCWTNLLFYCQKEGIEIILSNVSNCNIYDARNLSLGGHVTAGINQKPLGGIDYDYIMWIDSDIIFTPLHFQLLLGSDKDIVCGLYLLENGTNFAACQDYDIEFFRKTGNFPLMLRHEIPTDIFKVFFSGLGFSLIRRGVFEKIKYPWFPGTSYELNELKDFTMDDVGFCWKAQSANFNIFVNPKVVVGHEKKLIL